MSEERVNECLHDAERAHGGIMMANMVGDKRGATELAEKRDRLLAEAHALDPSHSHWGWGEPLMDCRPHFPPAETK